ncbi:MAG: carboxypeptidase regulatory-like domain-containing protein [Myxococcales bacterium]|nr:carboxypeptidase regulatory-like domain-containing protein [Myxococcales bacterium]
MRTVALLAGRVGLDPAYAPALFGKALALFAKIQAAAAACDDDAIKVQAAFATYTGELATLRRVEEAAKQFPSDANLTALAAIQADVALEAGRPGDAIAGYETVLSRHAAAGRRQAELDIAFELMKIHLDRSNPEDLVAVMALADRYRARAREVGRGAGVAALAARARWRLGDIDAANLEARDAGSAYSGAALMDSEFEPQNVKGTVVDERGKPVANAKVVAGARLWGDDAELSSPVLAIATTVETTTKADGTFELVGLKDGDGEQRRSGSHCRRRSPSMTLRLGPTSTVEGNVVLGGEPFSRVRVAIYIYGDKASQLHAGPVDRDGHFKLSRIPRGKHEITALLPDDTDAPQYFDVTSPVITGFRSARHEAVLEPRAHHRSPETMNPPDAAMAFMLREPIRTPRNRPRAPASR